MLTTVRMNGKCRKKHFWHLGKPHVRPYVRPGIGIVQHSCSHTHTHTPALEQQFPQSLTPMATLPRSDRNSNSTTFSPPLSLANRIKQNLETLSWWIITPRIIIHKTEHAAVKGLSPKTRLAGYHQQSNKLTKNGAMLIQRNYKKTHPQIGNTY